MAWPGTHLRSGSFPSSILYTSDYTRQSEEIEEHITNEKKRNHELESIKKQRKDELLVRTLRDTYLVSGSIEDRV